MATLKRRLNITLAPELDVAITRIAKRDNVPEATKAAELLAFAINLEEDIALETIASARDTKGSKLISHDAVWK